MVKIPITEIALLLFLSITFGFSTYEKIADFKEQVRWLTDYFKGTFMVPLIKITVIKILVLELITTVWCMGGMVQLFTGTGSCMAFWGCVLAIMVLLAFLVGQRIVKDYDGARNTTIYLIPAFFLLYLLS